MRENTSTYSDAYKAQSGKSVDLLKLVIPKKTGEAADIELYLCTDEPITVGTQVYTNAITRFPSALKQTLSRAPDGGDCAIENLSKTYGILLGDPDRNIAKTSAVISRALKVYGGVFEADPLFEGYIRNVKVLNTEVTFNLVSDMSRRGATVGGDPMTQHCRWVFNVQGNHPLGGHCAWTLAQGGNPNACLHTEEDCKAHNNIFHYGGIPQLRENTVQLDPQGDFDNGWDDGLYPHTHKWWLFDNYGHNLNL